MSGSIGLTEENTLLLIRFSGVAEILFGIAFIVFYRIGILVMLNIAGLVGLLVFVLVMTPSVLIEAFKPVTTNIPLIVLSIFLLRNEKQHRQTG